MSIADKFRSHLTNQYSRASSGNSGTNFFTFDPGKNIFRLMKHNNDPTTLGRVIGSHYLGDLFAPASGVKRIVCPKVTNEGHCPICELLDYVIELGDKVLAKKLKPRTQFLYNALKYGVNRQNQKIDEKFQVGIMQGGPMVYGLINEEFLAALEEDENMDFSDPSEGADLIITKTGVSLDTSYKCKFARQITKDVNALNAETVDLEKFTKCLPYDEIMATLGNTLMDIYDESGLTSPGKTGVSDTPTPDTSQKEEVEPEPQRYDQPVTETEAPKTELKEAPKEERPKRSIPRAGGGSKSYQDTLAAINAKREQRKKSA